jgi:hypothetical protein
MVRVTGDSSQALFGYSSYLEVVVHLYDLITIRSR